MDEEADFISLKHVNSALTGIEFLDKQAEIVVLKKLGITEKTNIFVDQK